MHVAERGEGDFSRPVTGSSKGKEDKMHYKNGREAKNGDKVVLIPSYGTPVIGILYDAVAGNDHCNGRIAVTAPNDPTPNLKECLHLDDVIAAVNSPVEVKSPAA
jgi:hypothetical protein